MSYHSEYQNKAYWKRKEKYIRALGGKCVNCESTDSLEFDHVDPKVKSYAVSTMLSKYSEKSIEAELLKCQLLCRRCHKVKSDTEEVGRPSPAKGTGKKHGSYYGVYRLKCRCVACSEYREQRLAKRRNSLHGERDIT